MKKSTSHQQDTSSPVTPDQAKPTPEPAAAQERAGESPWKFTLIWLGIPGLLILVASIWSHGC